MSSPDPAPVERVIEKLRTLKPAHVVQIEEFVDFLLLCEEGARHRDCLPAEYPIDSPGQWPADLSLRREDLYGDDGR